MVLRLAPPAVLALLGCQKAHTVPAPVSSASSEAPAVALAAPETLDAPRSAAPAPSVRAPPTGPCSPPRPEALLAASPISSDTVVYVEDSPGDDSSAPRQDLCLRIGESAPRLLVRGHDELPDAGVETTLAAFSSLHFSADGKSLYFDSAAWAVENALHVVDIATGRERYLTSGALLAEPTDGPYRGKLIVGHFRLDPDHPIGSPAYLGRIPVFALHTRDGRELRRLSENDPVVVEALAKANASEP
jgi:hypothetical protein